VHFSRKRQDESAPKFFSGFRRKHLFITTCVEKQCIRPLRIAANDSRARLWLGGHGFESHSQLFLPTYPGLEKFTILCLLFSLTSVTNKFVFLRKKSRDYNKRFESVTKNFTFIRIHASIAVEGKVEYFLKSQN